MSTEKCQILTMYYEMPNGETSKAILAAFETKLEVSKYFQTLKMTFRIEECSAEELEAQLPGFKEFINDSTT